MSIFLEPDDVAILTGEKRKDRQITQLRRMGLVFYVNATGRPVVPKSSVDKSTESNQEINKPWIPNVLNHG